MKIAISVPEDLGREVDRIAKACKVPRSRVYVAAVREHLKRLETKIMLENLNAAYSGTERIEDKEFSRLSKTSMARIQAREKY
jgi:metal-responsive CopG/Arc/MetJ family transcriptional regulator